MQLLGEDCKVPGELEATLRNIPEQPRMIKPLQLHDDSQEEEVADEHGEVTDSKETSLEDEKTPIQKLVEERFSRQAEVKTESPPHVELENQEPLGMKKNSSSQVTEGIDFLLGKAFPVSEMSSGGVKESLVTGGLRHVIERGTKDK